MIKQSFIDKSIHMSTTLLSLYVFPFPNLLHFPLSKAYAMFSTFYVMIIFYGVEF